MQRLKRIDNKNTICIIGKGHSGTRLIGWYLYYSGVYIGNNFNEAADLLPFGHSIPIPLINVSNIFGKQLKYLDNYSWDFSNSISHPITDSIINPLTNYLGSLIVPNTNGRIVAWKSPESVFVYPWLVKLLPNIKFVHWTRDPRDCASRGHGSDKLYRFSVPTGNMDIKSFYSFNRNLKGAINKIDNKFDFDLIDTKFLSWKYQWDIVKSIPKPKNYIRIKFEDFVLQKKETIHRLESFLGIKLNIGRMNPNKIGIWKKYGAQIHYKHRPFLNDLLKETGYENA